jgi:hypothetical protein
MKITRTQGGMLAPRLPMRRRLRVVAACCAFVTFLPPSATAATRIHVDTEAYPTLGVSVVLPHESASPPRVFENGRLVSIRYARAVGRASTIALAVDHSQSMHGQALHNAVAVARRLLADKRPGDRIALFAIGSKAVQLTDFSRSSLAAEKALGRLAVDGHYGTALYDGVVLAARALQRERARDKVLILVTDGQETTSQAGFGDAATAAGAGNFPVYPVAIADVAYKGEELSGLARATRGVFFGAATGPSRTNYRAIAADLRRTWRLEYTTTARVGDAITLRVVQSGSPPQIASVTIGHASAKKSFPFVAVALVLGVLAAVVVLLVVLRARRGRARS